MDILHGQVSPFHFLISRLIISKEGDVVRQLGSRFHNWRLLHVMASISNFTVLLLEKYRIWQFLRLYGFSGIVKESLVIGVKHIDFLSKEIQILLKDSFCIRYLKNVFKWTDMIIANQPHSTLMNLIWKTVYRTGTKHP